MIGIGSVEQKKGYIHLNYPNYYLEVLSSLLQKGNLHTERSSKYSDSGNNRKLESNN